MLRFSRVKRFVSSSLVPASTSRFEEVRFLGTKLQRSRSKAVALFSFEGAFHSFNCFASASSSRFGEAGFLDAKLQGSRLKKPFRSLKTR